MSSPYEVEELIARSPAMNVPGTLGLNIGCKDRAIGSSLGVDIRPKAKAAVIIADARALPFKSDTLDYIVSCHCLEHLRDGPLPVLREWVRCLKVDATLAVAVPYGRDDPDAALLYQVPRGRTIEGQHVHLFDMENLTSYMRCAGLEGVSGIVIDREPYWKSKVVIASGRKGKDYQESPYRWRAWTWSLQILRDVPWRARLRNVWYDWTTSEDDLRR